MIEELLNEKLLTRVDLYANLALLILDSKSVSEFLMAAALCSVG